MFSCILYNVVRLLLNENNASSTFKLQMQITLLECLLQTCITFASSHKINLKPQGQCFIC